ncbi:MAG: hypothetical protein ABR511_12235 [Acidimicrobiales bacterium]
MASANGIGVHTGGEGQEDDGIGVDEHATVLADVIDSALAGWVERSVARRLPVAPPEVTAAAAAAGARARAEVGPRVRALLAADVDQQRTTPLAILRSAVTYATDVLADAGVPPVARDEVQQRLFPADVYDLAPASFADVDPSLADPGLAWGAAKAWVSRRRHARREAP